MLLISLAFAVDTVIDLDGEVSEGDPAFVLVDFEVPAGIAEIEVRHTSLTDGNVLDWGLQGPSGTRGWGGGNSEPAVVGADAASRSYLPGPIEPGTWQVVIGKALLDTAPYSYDLEIVLRTEATLPQQAREPYAASAPLETGRRWYAGDFHVHSDESGDARATLDEIADLARARGLDFVAITDHNTISTLDFLVEAQARHPDVLFIPAMEFTTYHGHANAIGNTALLDQKLGVGDATVEKAIADAHGSGALFSINHPVLDLGDRCLGCAWEHEVDWSTIDAVEIETGGLSPAGALFVEDAIAFWDAACAQGFHVAALGGSDDHRAGQDLGLTGSPLGDPTTMVEADELSVAGILAGIRAGRTVVKLQGPEDPMVALQTSADPETGAVHASAVVTGGLGRSARLVLDGVVIENVPVDADPFTLETDVTPAGTSRLRAEIWQDGLPRVVSSHAWLEPVDVPDDERGCGCQATRGPAGLLGLALVVGVVGRRRALSSPASRGSTRCT